MGKVVAITLLAEPAGYATEQLLKKKKKPIRRIIFCCVDADPMHVEAAYSAVDTCFDEFKKMVDDMLPTEEIAAQMSESLSQEAGFRILCVPIETSTVVQVLAT